ncbi:MAG: 4-hydroxythreonine-4-phosphate dehydrogenase PdxA [Alphaproteobacteria bacterium]
MSQKPIAVTMGEPSGISSEIIIKAWKKRKEKKLPPFILVDDIQKLHQVNNLFDLDAHFHSIKNNEDPLKIFQHSLPVIDIRANIKLSLGKPDSRNSKYVIKSINKAFELVYSKQASAILTLPVCKKTLKKAEFRFHGQTEYLSYLAKKKTGEKNTEIMILSTTKPVDKGSNLIVGLVTTHIPLLEVKKELTKKLIEQKLISFRSSLQKFWNIKNPRIAISGMNPHAGEGGLIGNEEIRVIKPVLTKFSKNNIKILGPLSSDSCFHKSSRYQFDGILCLYHDQGLIPIKTLDFDNSINVTGGLPFIRVSPDHGPAFDIANKNNAKLDSLFSSFNFLKEVIK